MDIQCKVAKIFEPDQSQLTVGERFSLDCKSTDKQFSNIDVTKLELRTDTNDKYKINYERTIRQAEDQIKIYLRSDRVGDHKFEALQLVDSQNSIVLPNFEVSVRSVQDPKNPVQEPYSGFGPVSIALPVWFWLTLFGILFSFFISIFVRLWFVRQRKQMLANALDQAGAQEPQVEYFAALRRLKRIDLLLLSEALDPKSVKDFALELKRSTNLFISRISFVPFLSIDKSSWTSKKSIGLLAKENKNLEKKTVSIIYELYIEIDKLIAADTQSVYSRDLLQLLSWANQIASDLPQQIDVKNKISLLQKLAKGK